VRDHVLKNYIEPARTAKSPSVQVRAGDVHKALNYHARLPLVCSALTAISFRRAQQLTAFESGWPGPKHDDDVHVRTVIGYSRVSLVRIFLLRIVLDSLAEQPGFAARRMTDGHGVTSAPSQLRGNAAIR
jgi:hypothetical protein